MNATALLREITASANSATRLETNIDYRASHFCAVLAGYLLNRADGGDLEAIAAGMALSKLLKLRETEAA